MGARPRRTTTVGPPAACWAKPDRGGLASRRIRRAVAYHPRPMSDTSLTVIGAGAVGLAVAARLAERFPDLILLERREHHGTETSSRNSEVIHAGMYYTPGSLKARLCVEGNRLLYEYCAKHDVPH